MWLSQQVVVSAFHKGTIAFFCFVRYRVERKTIQNRYRLQKKKMHPHQNYRRRVRQSLSSWFQRLRTHTITRSSAQNTFTTCLCGMYTHNIYITTFDCIYTFVPYQRHISAMTKKFIIGVWAHRSRATEDSMPQKTFQATPPAITTATRPTAKQQC